jgi:large subunit ribosomal protein L28
MRNEAIDWWSSIVRNWQTNQYLGIREMAKRCDVCEKGPTTGRSYTFLRSHWNPHNKRRWLPNLQPVRVKLQNSVKKMKVCTSCLKAGKVQRAL